MGLPGQLLAARDARQAVIVRAAADLRQVLLFVGTNVPGPDKRPPGLGQVFGAALRAVAGAIHPGSPFAHGTDALGPWAALATPGPAHAAKRAAVDLEETLAGGRLIDVDVYDAGRPVDRRALGLAARPCLLCDQPAVDCMRAARHHQDAVVLAARDLLRAAAGALPAGRLAAELVAGARAELDLTPKPGLVDRLDNGSHPDLSFDAMSRSVDLLPAYFDELLDLHGEWPFAVEEVLAEAVQAGRRAEQRMLDAIGSNAHRGYIFLAGLLLLAAADVDSAGITLAAGPSIIGQLRARVARLAGTLMSAPGREDRPDAGASHGARVRGAHGLGGIHREARGGLSSVFDHGLPALERTGGRPVAVQRHHLMSVLMQVVEDTTAVYRCGVKGLERLRRDGAELQGRIEHGAEYLPWLADLNADYRRIGLTMGGVADCLALTLALAAWLASPSTAPGQLGRRVPR